MSVVVWLSILARFAAFAWAAKLLFELKDWRIGYLAAMAALMMVCQVETGLPPHGPGPAVLGMRLIEIPSLGVGVLAFLAVVYVGRLIKDHRQDKAELVSNRDELLRVLDAVPALVAYVDASEKYRFVNHAFELWLGIDRAKTLGRDVRDVIGMGHYEDVKPTLEAALAGERVTSAGWLEFPMRGHRYIEWTYVPDLDANGVAKGFFAFIEDLTGHKRAIDQLEDNRSLVEQAAAVAKLGFMVWSSKTQRLTQVSDGVLKIFGRANEELLVSNEDYLDLVHPEDRALVRIATATRKRQINSNSYRVLRPDGEVRHVCVVSYYVPDGEPRHYRQIATIQDVTEQKAAEQALSRSEERFRDFVDIASDWCWETDDQHRYSFWSSGMPKSLGWVPEEFLGTKVSDVQPVATDLGAWEQHLADFYHRRPFRDFVCAWRTADGEVRYVRSNGKPLYDEAGIFVGFRGVSSDITGVVEAHAAEQRSAERLTQAVQAFPAAFALFDAEDRLVVCNKEYRDSCELGDAQVRPGVTLSHLIQETLNNPRVSSESEHWIKDRVNWRKNPVQGAERPWLGDKWIEISDFPLDDGGMITICVDVTSRKKAEQARRDHETALAQLLRRNTMGEMAAAMAHELNQPLTAVANFSGGCLRRLRQDRVDLADLITALEEICTQSQRASEVLRRIRDFVGVSQPDKAPVQIEDILGSVYLLMKPELDASHVTYRVRLEEDLPPIHASGIEIEQVILNLVMNAIEAIRERNDGARSLEISAGRSGGCDVELAVRDSGVGFPSGRESQVFGPYVTTKANGLGMGLAISKTIVEAHGGRIWVENNSCDGATVRMTLPMVEEAGCDVA